MAVTALCGVGQRDRRSRFLFVCSRTNNVQVMSKHTNIALSANNSNEQVTSTHETGKYSNPELQAILASGSPYSTLELQAAYDAGRRIGIIEGMISYQCHLIENLKKENVQLSQKFKTLKGGHK